jgi:hypothetical protein
MTKPQTYCTSEDITAVKSFTTREPPWPLHEAWIHFAIKHLNCLAITGGATGRTVDYRSSG